MDADWTAQQKAYFRQVKRKLNYSRKLRRQILGDLAAAIEDSPEADYAELERRFGTPTQFVPKAEALGKKNGWLLYPLGIALSGKQRTPGGGTDLACMMGREKTLARVKAAIEKLGV